MSESTTRVPWVPPPSAKAKNSLQRAVTALLNELAPEREVKRSSPVGMRIEQRRSPTGCVLQAANAAISVSWFAARDNHSTLGELQIVLWRGVVSQRSNNQEPNGATIISELLLLPVFPIEEECLWQSADGEQFNSVAAAAKCMALLEEAIVANP